MKCTSYAPQLEPVQIRIKDERRLDAILPLEISQIEALLAQDST
jgi:hypothetical protein